MGLVGESGCDKSSTARAVMGFIHPVSGRIRLNGQHLLTGHENHLKRLQSKFQMIFQDSAASFNPRKSIGTAITVPLKLMGIKPRAERIRRAHRMMERVGLDPCVHDRFPHQLSGGQCQRAQIARALITTPELLICDEPVSCLDVLIQAQILALLQELQKTHRLGMLFISHDLAVVKKICDRVAVMYAGKICETADCRCLYETPRHPYSKALLRAIPMIGRFKNDDTGFMPIVDFHNRNDPASGCSYRKHCHRAREKCFHEEPVLTATAPDGYVACHFPA